MCKEVITYPEIEAKFTEVINRYIRIGYRICTTTMADSQGELSKVDLYHPDDSNRVIRVLLDRTVGNGVCLTVIEFKDWNGYDTLRNGKGNSITHITYYNITGDFIDRRNAKFVTEQKKYESIRQKKRSRWADKYGCGDGIERDISIPEARKKNILSLVRQHKGYKTVAASDITIICRYDTFYAIKFGHKHDLLIHMVGRQ